MSMKLKSLVAAVALAAAGASQAALVDSTDILVNIRLDGADGPSMLINTNLNAMDLATGTVDSFVSDAALTQQINNFISGASGSVEYWVIGGYKPNAFSNTVLSTRTLGDATTTNQQPPPAAPPPPAAAAPCSAPPRAPAASARAPAPPPRASPARLRRRGRCWRESRP